MFGDILMDSIIKKLTIRIREVDGVNLGQGIPSFPTAPHIIEAARQALGSPTIGVYPNFVGVPELRQAIVTKINLDHKAVFDADKHIIITVGAMEGTACAIFAVTDVHDRVGFLSPDYCNHYPQIQISRGIPVEIPLKEEKSGWVLDRRVLVTTVKKGLRLLIITNPSNPTGAVLTADDIDYIDALSQKYGFYIVSDETYSFLSFDAPFTSFISKMKENNRIMVVRSFSKEYAMTGWRVGYLLCGEEVMSPVAKVHDALTGCAPKISQYAAIAAINGPQDIVSQYFTVLKKRRDMVCALLDDIPGMTYGQPHGAYYVFPKYPGSGKSMDVITKILETAHVAVVPGSVFGNIGEGHIRISFAVEDSVLSDGLHRLKQYFHPQ